MNFFRHLNLQRTLSTLVLFGALFSQIQTLYACDSMTNKPMTICCCGDHDANVCPMSDSCNMQAQSTETLCCEISYDTLNDAGMMNSISTVDQLTLLLDASQPPPLIEAQKFSSAPLLYLSLLSLTDNEPWLSNPGRPTYLQTHRLRL